MRGIADDKNPGVFWNRQILLNLDPTGPIQGKSERRQKRRRLIACRPDDMRGLNEFAPDRQAISANLTHPAIDLDRHAFALERNLRFRR